MLGRGIKLCQLCLIAGEKLAEKAAEEMLGGDVDIDGDKITVTDKSGNKATLGGTEWPAGTIGSKIPEFV